MCVRHVLSRMLFVLIKSHGLQRYKQNIKCSNHHSLSNRMIACNSHKFKRSAYYLPKGFCKSHCK